MVTDFNSEEAALTFIRAELKRQSLSYMSLAERSGVKLSTLRQIMSPKARQSILLKDVSAIYRALGFVLLPSAIKQQASCCSVFKITVGYVPDMPVTLTR